MKNNIKYLSIGLGLALTLSSCEKSLDINDNPNEPIASTPQLVLPQAMVATAQMVPQFNTYGSRLVGYYATSGGVSGWSDMITYDFTTGNFAALWSGTFNALNDLQYVINETAEVTNQQDFNQAAQILRAYNFANLVDTYNDIPYTESLQGISFLTPKYDDAATIYVDLAKRLDAAVAYFKSAEVSSDFEVADIIFGGDTELWAQFANTLKLRLVLRSNGKATFENKTIDAIGVLEDDVLVQPGFAKIAGKQNPMWNTWAYSGDGAAVGTWGTQFIPTPYIMAFYDGFKLLDDTRADLVFANGISTNKNQLGNTIGAPSGISPSAWVIRPNSGSLSSSNYSGIGAIKGPLAGQPLLLAAESQFLAAEAVVEGLMSGDLETYFNNGLKASYDYLNKDETDNVVSDADADAFLALYLDENSGAYLADISIAAGKEQQKEAIITQKYIAFNFLFGHEAWNEYRRTGYPKIVAGTDARTTFVSTNTNSTAPDKLPTRILYPSTEFSYNSANVPAINKYSSKIFWAK